MMALVGCRRQTSNPSMNTTQLKAGSELSVHYMDVGQGDATLIVCDGRYMLIDAGENDKGTAVQLYLMKQGVEELDYLVLTHPDADHIGGADVVITKFDCDRILMPEFAKDSKTYRDVQEAMKYKNLRATAPQVGATYRLGSATFTIVAPNKADYGDQTNNYSVGLLLQYGQNRFLFTGDAETEAEQDMLDNGISIQADVYKAGHHGSSTSSSLDLLKAVQPTYAVISCGVDNSYGHPHAETLNHFRQLGIQVFRTDEQGTIIATSDGKNIIWNTASSESWQVGEATQASIYYIGNKNNGKLHLSTCSSLPKEENQVIFETKQEAEAAGFTDSCGNCKP